MFFSLKTMEMNISRNFRYPVIKMYAISHAKSMVNPRIYIGKLMAW